jgi:phosphoglycolate phosphatase-like HAD superfamily hydrolase
MTKAVIFDIDGTLADTTHRLHHIKAKPPNWDAFFADDSKGPLIEPIRDLARLVAAQNYRIILVSGRTDKVRRETEAWLTKHAVPHQEFCPRDHSIPT